MQIKLLPLAFLLAVFICAVIAAVGVEGNIDGVISGIPWEKWITRKVHCFDTKFSDVQLCPRENVSIGSTAPYVKMFPALGDGKQIRTFYIKEVGAGLYNTLLKAPNDYHDKSKKSLPTGIAGQAVLKRRFYIALFSVFFGLLGSLFGWNALYDKRHFLGAALILGGLLLAGAGILLFWLGAFSTTWGWGF